MEEGYSWEQETEESLEETVLKKCSDQKCSYHNSTIEMSIPPVMTMNVLKKIGMNFSVSLKRNNFKSWKKKGVGWKEI